MDTHRSISRNRFRVASFRVVWAMALILFLVAIPVFAQLATGTILGVVKDSSGGTVAGAAVTIVNTETNQSRSLTTGEDGAYHFPGTLVGHYTVKIEKEGFKTQTQ